MSSERLRLREKPRHRGDQDQAHLPRHADIVRQPGITRVHPPDRHQHQQRPQEIHRSVGVLHQLGDLRDHENENQIEEELDGGNAGGFFVHGGGHGERRGLGWRCRDYAGVVVFLATIFSCICRPACYFQ